MAFKMIEVCECGFPKSKHLDLGKLDAVKNLQIASEIVQEIVKEYMKDQLVYGESACLIYRQDNLRALEAEAQARGI